MISKNLILSGLIFTVSASVNATADHLILTEAVIDAPNAATQTGTEPIVESDSSSGEYIEIYNPTNVEIDLHQYFISDANATNNEYFRLPVAPKYNSSGVEDPNGINKITVTSADYLYQFPAGAKLGPKQVAVVAQNARRFLYHYFNGFSSSNLTIPDRPLSEMESNLTRFTNQPGSPLLFEITDANNTFAAERQAPHMSSVPKMINRTINTSLASDNVTPRTWNLSLTNNGEFIVLFQWDENNPDQKLIKDVDIVTWSLSSVGATSADRWKAKSGITLSNGATYLTDNGSGLDGGNLNAFSGSAKPVIYRTNHLENGEPITSGNGISGHDESMETVSSSWVAGGIGGSTAWNSFDIITPGFYSPENSSVTYWSIY